MDTKQVSGGVGQAPVSWRVVENSWSTTSIYAGSECVAVLDISGEATEENQDELAAIMAERARLIGAAPSLLNALTVLAEACEQMGIPCEAARAAISAATGAST